MNTVCCYCTGPIARHDEHAVSIAIVGLGPHDPPGQELFAHIACLDEKFTPTLAAEIPFDAEIFEHLRSLPPGKNGEIQLTDAIQRLIENGRKVLGVRLPADERRFDIGNYESYFEAFLEFALTDPKQGKGLRQFARKWLAEHGDD